MATTLPAPATCRNSLFSSISELLLSCVLSGVEEKKLTYSCHLCLTSDTDMVFSQSWAVHIVLSVMLYLLYHSRNSTTTKVKFWQPATQIKHGMVAFARGIKVTVKLHPEHRGVTTDSQYKSTDNSSSTNSTTDKVQPSDEKQRDSIM